MNMLFLFESRNIKMSEIYKCKLIIIHVLGNPLKYGVGNFPSLIHFFPGKKVYKIQKKKKKTVGQIRGDFFL